MKTSRSILLPLIGFAVALVPTHVIKASEFHADSFEMKVSGISYRTQTSEENLRDAPKWDPLSGEVFPIPVKEILSRASNQIEKEIPSIVSLYPIRIEHRISAIYGAWFSMVVFSYGLESGPTSGVGVPFVVAVVYADGSVAPIKRSDGDKGNRRPGYEGKQ
jgi:hypothetical protein